MIPGVNYDEVTLKRMYEELLDYKNLMHVEILPFHILGRGKYRGLGMEYKYKDMKSLQNHDLETYKKLGRDMGLDVIIGSI